MRRSVEHLRVRSGVSAATAAPAWASYVRKATVCLFAPLLAVGGCAKPVRTIDAAFPRSSQASPWALANSVWSGTPTEAAAAIGDDWHRIEPRGPTHVWLATYRHETLASRTITVRAIQFASPEVALRTYDALRPRGAPEFRMGDVGCWTELGVLFAWGDTLFEMFGNDAAWEPAWQTVFIAGLLEKNLPPRGPGSRP